MANNHLLVHANSILLLCQVLYRGLFNPWILCLLKAIEWNDQAVQLLNSGLTNEALSLFQQVFFDYENFSDDIARIQVARALYYVAKCNREAGKVQLAEQIEQTLQLHYARDVNPTVRYWAELTSKGISGDITYEKVAFHNMQEQESTNPELDAFLEELLITKKTKSQYDSDKSTILENNLNSALTEKNQDSSLHISENAVTIEKLHQILRSAYMNSNINGENSLKVQLDGVTVLLRIRPEYKLLQFLTVWQLHRYADMEEKLKLANRINCEFIFVRAAVHDQDAMVIDSFQSYAFGIFPHQVVHSLRLLLRIGQLALLQSDEDNVAS